MSNSKHDRSTVASKQPYELRTICRKFKIKVKDLRVILLEIGQNGKPEHSRAEIEKELEKRGYVPGKGRVEVIYDPYENEHLASNGLVSTSGNTREEAIKRLEEEND